MALLEVNLRSGSALGRMTQFTAIVPEGKTGPFPVLYLLHGLSDDNTAWARRTSLERYVENLSLIVVMPNGQRSWYVDAAGKPNENYETYITQELVAFVDATFQTIPEARGRAIAGLSMGGFGSVLLGVKHPDIFSAVHSFSGAVDMASRTADPESDWYREMSLVFGPEIAGTDKDIFSVVRKSAGNLPALSFDCGVDDFLIQHNRNFDALLMELGIPHVYNEYPGGHDWSYWDEHIQHVLPWVMEQVG